MSRRLISDYRKKLKDKIKAGAIIDEDDRMTLRFVGVNRMEVTPKEGVDLKDLHIEFITKMLKSVKYRILYNSFNIWIDEEKGVVVLSK